LRDTLLWVSLLLDVPLFSMRVTPSLSQFFSLGSRVLMFSSDAQAPRGFFVCCGDDFPVFEL